MTTISVQTLGMEHLRQGLTEQACMDCSCLNVVAQVARIDQLERELNPHPPPAKSHLGSPKARKRRADTREVPAKMRRKLPKPEPLNQKVDTLASEFPQIKAMLLNLQPLGAQPAGDYPAAASRSSSEQPPVLSPAGDAREEDVLSIRASENLATVDEWAEDQGDMESDGSYTRDVSGHTSLRGSVASQTSAIKPAVKVALARLGLDAAPAQESVQSAFFKQAPSTSSFSVPPSAPFIMELQRCWADPKRFSHLPSDCRTLASMQDAASHGLAALILSPEEALRPDACCPRPQCRLTDELIGKSYDSAARVARIGNSMSHLILSLSQTLQSSGADRSMEVQSEASLKAFAYMARELGRLMSSLTLARRQIWLAQSPLTEPCRKALRSLAVVPGQLFGPAAQQTLERSLQVMRTRQQFASLRRTSIWGQRPTTTGSSVTEAPSTKDSTFLGSASGTEGTQYPSTCQHPFEPLGSSALKWVSLKTAFLLAMSSAKRVGELHALSVSRES
ncbi:hypothetical protein N1851_031041 [Merluccius polli]|uniref:Uncharacterized protein n=1 Tax=Merluccius polli TaxID=89951 RepID=A0AA47NPL3_MERPO|nr:hypothetical protein N1851_031041 [Merluccius polli]